MGADRHTRLEDFVELYAQTLGGLVERDEQGDVQLLDPASGTLRLLVFEPEGLAERPEAELVAPGSAALEAFLTEARNRGRVGAVRLEVPMVPDRLVETSVIRTLRVPGAAVRVEQLRWTVAEHAVFLFRASFVSDAREEELVEVVVDRSTGRLVRRWDALRAAGSLSEGPPRDPTPARLSLQAAYEMARAEALRNLSSRLTQHHRSLTEWKQREVRRLRQYHQELEEELAERAQKERAEPRRRALLARLDANRLQAQRAAQDLEAKYALVVELECASLLLAGVPKALATCRLDDPKRLRQAQVDVMWNLALRAAEPVDCPGCAQPEFEFVLQHEGLACIHCAKPGAGPRTVMVKRA